MSLNRRISRLEETSKRRSERGKPPFRVWLAAEEGIPVDDLDPSIQSFADLRKHVQQEECA